MSESVDRIPKSSVILTDYPTGYKSLAISDQEWLSLYPEETAIMLQEKLAELEPEAAKLTLLVVDNFKKASRDSTNFENWLIYDYPTEAFLIPRLTEVKRQIKRFKWLLSPKSIKERITDSDIEYARQVPLENVLGLDLRPAGGGKLKTTCPFHEERTASFIVFPDNHYHCFSCGKHGNPVDYLVEKERLSFIEAVMKLKQYGGGTPVS